MKYALTLNENQKYIADLTHKLQVFKALPEDQQFLASMELQDLLTHIAKVEQDPFVLYHRLEQAYRPNVFESVIFKKYSHLFDENSEASLKEQLEQLKAVTANQLAIL